LIWEFKLRHYQDLGWPGFDVERGCPQSAVPIPNRDESRRLALRFGGLDFLSLGEPSELRFLHVSKQRPSGRAGFRSATDFAGRRRCDTALAEASFIRPAPGGAADVWAAVRRRFRFLRQRRTFSPGAPVRPAAAAEARVIYDAVSPGSRKSAGRCFGAGARGAGRAAHPQFRVLAGIGVSATVTLNSGSRKTITN
jgi:hypothetical protein